MCLLYVLIKIRSQPSATGNHIPMIKIVRDELKDNRIILCSSPDPVRVFSFMQSAKSSECNLPGVLSCLLSVGREILINFGSRFADEGNQLCELREGLLLLKIAIPIILDCLFEKRVPYNPPWNGGGIRSVTTFTRWRKIKPHWYMIRDMSSVL